MLLGYFLNDFEMVPVEVVVHEESSWTTWPLKMGQIGCPETSITNYQSTLRNDPEERRLRCITSQDSDDLRNEIY
jgi:hypothetical protein